MARADVVQIIPAAGWYAVFDHEQSHATVTLPIACFALHSSGVIEAMICGAGGRLCYLDEMGNDWRPGTTLYEPNENLSSD